MSVTSAYEELERRTRELEKEVQEYRRSKATLKESETRLQSILDNTPAVIYLKNTQGRYILINRTYETLFHIRREQIAGKTDYDIFPAGRADAYWKHDQRVIEAGKPLEFEEIVPHDDGIHTYISVKFPLLDSGGVIYGVCGISTDITERKRAEGALEDERDRVRNYLDIAGFIILVLNRDQTVALINKRGCGILGYDEEEIIGKNWYDNFVPEKIRDDVRKSFEKLMAGDIGPVEYFENALLLRDGGERVIRWHNTVLRDNEARIIATLSSGEDVTERKELEIKLRESEERYRAIVNQSADGIYVADLETCKVIEANPALCQMLGYRHDELLGKTLYDFVAHTPEDVRQRLQEARRHGHASGERCYRRKDGSLIEVEVSVNFITYGERNAFTGLTRDISERKRLQMQLQQAQKMEAIGTLAGGIAHDFNNLLMAIQGSTSLMLLHLDSESPQFYHLMTIESAVKKAAKLTRQLLGFARGGKYEILPTDLNGLVERSAELFRRTRKDISIYTSFQETVWAAEVDRGQIEQVLLDLFLNAGDAMPKGGELRLQTENVTIHEEYKKRFRVDPGRYVKVTVNDTGLGMDKETQARIFEPFFTTKGMGKSTGLGLASAYGIVKGHGGFINVYSERGKGATFTIYLPVSEKLARQEEKIQPEVLTGEETILFVDDEDINREVGEALLNAMGYKAIVARDGKEAIELYKEKGGIIDLVVLDMIMPGMSGGETYDKLREINSEIRVILSSGYSLAGEASKIMERGCEGFIQKPFDMTAFSKKIREILDRDVTRALASA